MSIWLDQQIEELGDPRIASILDPEEFTRDRLEAIEATIAAELELPSHLVAIFVDSRKNPTYRTPGRPIGSKDIMIQRGDAEPLLMERESETFTEGGDRGLNWVHPYTPRLNPDNPNDTSLDEEGKGTVVDRPPRSLTIRETVLLITHASGDTVAGRTIMQKLAYFTGLRLSTGMGHRPHFYGPFSSKVEDAVSNAVLAGDLHETVERMPHRSGGPDLRKYTYVLTENGKRRVEDLIEHRPEQWGCVRDAVHVIKEVLPTFDQETLSTAANTYLVIGSLFFEASTARPATADTAAS